MSEIFWVHPPAGRLAVLTCPQGGEWLDLEARDLRSSGLDIVVSLLEPDEARRLGLSGERQAVESQGMTFISLPIEDGGTPASMSEARDLVADLVEKLKTGKAVGVHCRAAIGRSPMIAAAILISLGVPLRTALRQLSLARGYPVPETDEQLGWLEEFEGPA
jgi:protein-tyrosine phosphatase